MFLGTLVSIFLANTVNHLFTFTIQILLTSLQWVFYFSENPKCKCILKDIIKHFIFTKRLSPQILLKKMHANQSQCIFAWIYWKLPEFLCYWHSFKKWHVLSSMIFHNLFPLSSSAMPSSVLVTWILISPLQQCYAQFAVSYLNFPISALQQRYVQFVVGLCPVHCYLPEFWYFRLPAVLCPVCC